MDKITQRMKEIEILTVALSMLILIFFISYVINEHENIFIGMYKIITSPAVLVTDFMQVGGIGAAFLNAILIFSFNFFLVKSFKVKINGITIAAFFTVFGFSFFGKNILNILPFYLGGILYSIYTSTDFSEHIIPIAFSSALAPFVSSVAFYGDISYETSYINAILIGVLIGFIVVPLARSLFDFHEGYDLYNLGFTAGILGSVIIAVLKLYHFEITPQFLLSTEYDSPLKILCSAAFTSLIIIGFYINDNSLSGYFSLIKDDGYKSDFTQKYGYGLTFINMGIMGFISMGFVVITGQTFNGPVLAGIFTVVGFSANGKTVFNTIPVLIGVLLGLLAIVGVIGGKIYIDSNKMENIVKSDKAKEAIEAMLKKMEAKALTSEGNIKSYKIDYDKVKANPMGGINISVIVNDNQELSINTTLEKDWDEDGYKTGARTISPELWKMTDRGKGEVR